MIKGLFRRQGGALIPSIAAFMAGAAGVAFAGVVVPDGGGHMNVCYDSVGGGNIRFVDKQPGDCANPNEVGATWNQTGPQGAQGPAGPPLASHAVTATRRRPPDAVNGPRTVLQHTSLPSGKYLVNATQVVDGYAECWIVEGANNKVAYSEAATMVHSHGRSRITYLDSTLALSGLANVPAFGRLRLLCHGRLQARGNEHTSSFTAVRVAD